MPQQVQGLLRTNLTTVEGQLILRAFFKGANSKLRKGKSSKSFKNSALQKWFTFFFFFWLPEIPPLALQGLFFFLCVAFERLLLYDLFLCTSELYVEPHISLLQPEVPWIPPAVLLYNWQEKTNWMNPRLLSLSLEWNFILSRVFPVILNLLFKLWRQRYSKYDISLACSILH